MVCSVKKSLLKPKKTTDTGQESKSGTKTAFDMLREKNPGLDWTSGGNPVMTSEQH